jgi:S-formylglutathione hydrolase FrmB
MDWFSGAFLDTLAHYCLLRQSDKNFILGLSTGGRGAVLCAMRHPERFRAVAALSGDFDQRQMPTDNLMTGYYGSYKKFAARWAQIDNPVTEVEKIKTPIYLGHGLSDKVVPAEQTKLLYQALREKQPQLQVKMHLVPPGGHDYHYWNSEIDSVLSFFKEFWVK